MASDLGPRRCVRGQRGRRDDGTDSDEAPRVSARSRTRQHHGLAQVTMPTLDKQKLSRNPYPMGALGAAFESWGRLAEARSDMALRHQVVRVLLGLHRSIAMLAIVARPY